MAQSKNSFLSALASSVTPSGTVPSAALAPEVTSSIEGAGTAVYDSASLLPISGNTAGDTAFVKSTSRLYIHSGVGWYNVAVINNTPTVQSITDSDGGTTPFTLATDGTPTTITITAQDSDGDPLTYNYSADSNFGGLATLSQDANVFTITPFSQDSATTTSGTITFSVTDGINTATPGTQTFTLTFQDPNWDLVKFSLQTESNTVSDKVSTPATLTLNGNSASSTYTNLDPQSLELPGTTNGVLVYNPTLQPMNFGTSFFTVEFFFYHYWTPIAYSGFWTAGTNNDGFSFGWGANSSSVRLKMLDNTVGTQTFNVGLAYNQWHHFAVTRGPAAAGQSNHRMTVWLNGSKVDHANIGETEVVNSTVGNGSFWIGKTLAESTSYLVKGWVDNFQVSHYCKYVDDGTSTTYTVPTVKFGPNNP